MALKTLVAMNEQGRVTIPAAARALLDVHGVTQFELEANEREIVLRPAVVISREDLWAYTPGHRASLDRALQQVREGRLRPATAHDLGSNEDEAAPSSQTLVATG